MANFKEISSEILSLKEASTISGYHADYLSLLIRRKKLEGIKVGKSWAIDRRDLEKLLRSKKKNVKIKIGITFLFILPIIIVFICIFNIFLLSKTDKTNLIGDFTKKSEGQTKMLKTQKIKVIEETNYTVDGEGVEINLPINN